MNDIPQNDKLNRLNPLILYNICERTKAQFTDLEKLLTDNLELKPLGNQQTSTIYKINILKDMIKKDNFNVDSLQLVL